LKLLSDDDLDLRGMSDEELSKAWDLWFDLAQHTNDDDPPFTHGVFVGLRKEDLEGLARPVDHPPESSSSTALRNDGGSIAG
jgi:hypothetical protein